MTTGLPVGFSKVEMKPVIDYLAGQGVLLGTSSWKYTGWLGQLYDPQRYTVRGRFSEALFNRQCLSEYAELFHTVGIDATYYRFPTRSEIASICEQVPDHFIFACKASDEITIKRFPLIDRFGLQAGQVNPNFLNVDLFCEGFLGPWEPCRSKLGLIIFEFSHFHPADYRTATEFVEDLDQFLGRLPPDWTFGVEIRNRGFLKPIYFKTLAKHKVVHVYNSWTYMPGLDEQLLIPESTTRPDLRVARLLLKPGRKYEEAVRAFEPYSQLKDPYPEGRRAAVRLIREAQQTNGAVRALIYVNNRFEGNALQTIRLICEESLGEELMGQLIRSAGSSRSDPTKGPQLSLPL